MKRAATALALWLCWLSAAGTEAQQRLTLEQSPRKAVLIGQVEPELLERIRGQTGDLDWNLRVVRVAETTGESDVEQARRIAEQYGAEAAIWFEAPASGGLVVKVVEVGQGRLLYRSIEPPGKAEVHAYSAMAEAAALVVRSSLMSLASGAPLGEPLEARATKPGPTEPESGGREAETIKRRGTAGRRASGRGPVQEQAARARSGGAREETPEVESTGTGREDTEADEPEVEATRYATASEQSGRQTETTAEPEQVDEPRTLGDARTRASKGATRYATASEQSGQQAETTAEPEEVDEPWTPIDARTRASIGWQVAVDGQSPLGQHALGLRLVLELERFEISVLGSLGLLAARLEDDAETLDVLVNRHAILGGLGVALLDGEELRLSAGVAAGVAFFYRRTEVSTDELRAEPSASIRALMMRIGLVGTWLPSGTGQALGLELELGAEVVPAAPVFSVQEPERVTDRFALWPVHAVAVLGVVFGYGI